MNEPIHSGISTLRHQLTVDSVSQGRYFTSKIHHDTYPAIDPRKQDLRGKYVFITGGSKGIGRATALAYGKAGCAGIGIGARSDLLSVASLIAQVAREDGKAVPQLETFTLDVTDQDSVAATAASVASVFPRIDILINNAGYLEKRKKIANSDVNEWRKAWSVNVEGVYLVTRAFLPLMLREGGAKIVVNISSIAAHLLAPGGSAYQISKLALLRFTEFLDVDHGPDGILTFAVHPGAVLTDMGKKMPVERQVFLTETPELCADTLVFLTQRRREWLAGRYISVTWDMNELLQKEEEIVREDKLKVRMRI